MLMGVPTKGSGRFGEEGYGLGTCFSDSLGLNRKSNKTFNAEQGLKLKHFITYKQKIKAGKNYLV